MFDIGRRLNRPATATNEGAGRSTRIVLGLDDDSCGTDLVEWVARQAGRETSVSAVHVVHRSEVWALASMMVDASKYLRAVRRRLEGCAIDPLHDCGVHASLTLALGDPARELMRMAARVDADEIVVGAGSHPDRHHLIRGGVAQRLEHLVTIPVIVVPHHRADRVMARPTET